MQRCVVLEVMILTCPQRNRSRGMLAMRERRAPLHAQRGALAVWSSPLQSPPTAQQVHGCRTETTSPIPGQDRTGQDRTGRQDRTGQQSHSTAQNGIRKTIAAKTRGCHHSVPMLAMATPPSPRRKYSAVRYSNTSATLMLSFTQARYSRSPNFRAICSTSSLHHKPGKREAERSAQVQKATRNPDSAPWSEPTALQISNTTTMSTEWEQRALGHSGAVHQIDLVLNEGHGDHAALVLHLPFPRRQRVK